MDKAQDNISSGDTIRIVFGVATVEIACLVSGSQIPEGNRVMLPGLYIKARQYLLTAAAVIMVLAGAYYLGGQAARRSMDIKAEREDRKRLRHRLDVKNDVINAVRSSDDTTVDAQLAADWMRD